MTHNTLTGIYQDAFHIYDGPSGDEVSIDDALSVNFTLRVRLEELAALAKTSVDLALEDGDAGQIAAIGRGMIAVLYAALDTNDRLDSYITAIKGKLNSGHPARGDDGRTAIPRSQIDRAVEFAAKCGSFEQRQAN